MKHKTPLCACQNSLQIPQRVPQTRTLQRKPVTCVPEMTCLQIFVHAKTPHFDTLKHTLNSYLHVREVFKKISQI